MDDGFGPRDWGCYYDRPTFKNSVGLQLMSSAGVDRSTKGLLGNGGALLHQECSMMPLSNPFPFDLSRDSWMLHREKFIHMLPMHVPNYAIVSDDHANIQMVPQHHQHEVDLAKDDKKPLQITEDGGEKDQCSKKPSASRSYKTSKPKKSKKVNEPGDGSAHRGKPARKSVGMVIHGMDLDISTLPAPMCTCTGVPHQCYRWGVGGWQSACCTTTLSTYPLPMSQKRRGARIAGRKMSQGAFKKVLEKLVPEGYDLSEPIDLRTYWAKHGTNKFVTIR